MEILARRKWYVIFIITFFITILHPPQAWAQDSRPVELFEEKIKAGLVYNLLKYTTWPQDALTAENAKLRVCLFGSNPVNDYLDPLKGRHAQQFVIDIIRVDQVSETKDCSMVFISASEKDSAPQLLEFLKNKQILTVSDIGKFASQGGMVELARENDQIVFYINTKTVKLEGLDMGSRLLKIAKLIPG